MTPRKREVLDLLCDGVAPKQIAARMHLSVHTIRQYIADLKRQHGVSSTQELVCAELKRRACTCGAVV